ncbi:MAG: triphosphoribosyl-dephospho-CoA synthase [Clostridiaceae bacterium]
MVPDNYLKTKDTESFHQKLARLAVFAMDMEVSTTPKPGLVDLENNGSHSDMDHSMFLKSSASLKSYFFEIAKISSRIPNPIVLPHLRNSGIEAEKRMLAAANGVNTHKGLIFSMGLLVGIVSNYCSKKDIKITEEDFPQIRKQITLNTEGLVNEINIHTDTHGHSAYKKHGVEGIRKEASLGYPAVFLTGYPSIKKYLKYYSLNTTLVLTLLELIQVTEDTNIIYRGGLDSLFKVRAMAKEILSQTHTHRQMDQVTPNVQFESDLIQAVRKMDKELISLNLSPGGSADNLALSIFLALITGLIT